MNSRFRIPLVLMLITMLVIATFQVYWLRNNYQAEKDLFAVRTNILFRETILRLQASKLHLDSNINIRVQNKEGVIGMTNLLQEKVRYATANGVKLHSSMIITMKKHDLVPLQDSTVRFRIRQVAPESNIADFLAGVDSLHEPITIKEVSDKYAGVLSRENISLPFSITLADTMSERERVPEDFSDNKVTVGFLHPLTYQLDFADSRLYLFRQMWQPILVSILLVGVTAVSFGVLYRNLVRQQKLTRMKNDFISNITHELKTPITTVSVALEALENFNALNDAQRTKEYLDISAQEIKRLGVLVDNVLKFSLFENRAVDLKKEAVDLVQMAGEVIESMKLQTTKQQAEMTLEYSGNHFTIEADRLHLTSVLYNLLDNSLKYSGEQAVIHVRVLDHVDFVELAVEDNGMGIPGEYRKKIFERFFRVPGSDRHNIKGYGLGLSYVNHIVQRHQGFIEVKSEVGKGSRFSVKLPFREAPVIHYDKGRKIRKITFNPGRS